MVLEVLAEEGGVGEVQVVGYLLHRHVSEAQTALNGFHGEELDDVAGVAVDGVLEQARQVFGRDSELAGKLVDAAHAAVAAKCVVIASRNHYFDSHNV